MLFVLKRTQEQEAALKALLDQQHNTRWQIRNLPDKIAEAKQTLADLRADIAVRDANDGEEFSMIVGTKEFSGKGAREEAAKALTYAVLTWRDDFTLQPRGSFKGFKILSRGKRLTGLELDGDAVPELFLKGETLYSAHLNSENPLGTMQSIEHTLRSLDKLAEQEQERGLRLEKTLADYQAQANKTFDHEARVKELLARQAQLNAALDLDKNEKQVALPAEDEIGRAGDTLQAPSIRPRVERSSAPGLSP